MVPIATWLLLAAPVQEAFLEDFDVLWSAVEQRYAYADRLDLDWAVTAERHRARAAAASNEFELLGVFEALLLELRDHHVHLGLNNERSPRLVPSHADLWAEWVEGQALITSVRLGSDAARAGLVPGDVVVEIRGADVATLLAQRLGVSPGKPLDPLDAGALGWALRVELAGSWNQSRALRVAGASGEREVRLGDAWAPDLEGPLEVSTFDAGEGSIGYVRFCDSLGDSDTIAAFDAALGGLRATRGLIVDLRETPGGGNSSVARAILGHFVSSPRPYQRHELVEEGRRTGVRRSWIEEVSPRAPEPYAGPVIVLVGRWTASMGEGLAMGFDALGARVVGGPMAGLLGALTEIELPNTGWRARFANERMTHVDGTPREDWTPSHLVVDATPDDSVDEVLRAALGLLQ